MAYFTRRSSLTSVEEESEDLILSKLFLRLRACASQRPKSWLQNLKSVNAEK